MPPIRFKSSQNSAYQQGKISLALGDLQNDPDQICSRSGWSTRSTRSTLHRCVQITVNSLNWKRIRFLNSHFLWTRVEQHLSLLLYEKWLKSILLRVEPTLRLR